MPRLQLFAPGPASLATTPDSRPHVLLVVDGFPKALGGGERVVLRLASLLPQQGFRVSILTFSIDPEGSLQPGNAPCPVYLLPLTKAWNFGALRGAVAFGRFLHRQNVAIVQTFFESSDLWAGLVTRLTSRARLIWSRRDMGILRSPKHGKAYRALRRLPHAVMAVSSKVAEHVIQEDGVAASRVYVVHNGIELTHHAPAERNNTPSDALTITTVGNIRRVKGHDVLLKAACRVWQSYPKTLFTIAGDVLEPEFHAELAREIDTSGFPGNFRLLGAMHDLPVHLTQADIFVLPSRSEGFSNALVEAMAAGLPVVATDVGGNAEAVEAGVTGLIVPPEDPDALAEALLLLCASPTRRQAYGQAGRAAVESRFTTSAMVRKTAQVYHKVLADRG